MDPIWRFLQNRPIDKYLISLNSQIRRSLRRQRIPGQIGFFNSFGYTRTLRPPRRDDRFAAKSLHSRGDFRFAPISSASPPGAGLPGGPVVGPPVSPYGVTTKWGEIKITEQRQISRVYSLGKRSQTASSNAFGRIGFCNTRSAPSLAADLKY